MSPGGTDASLLQLLVGFFAAAALLSVLTVFLRRRSGKQDLLGTQVREMEARTAASPDGDTRSRDAATRAAEARIHEATSRDSASPPAAPSPADAVSSGTSLPDVTAGDRPAPDATAPPDGWPMTPGGEHDAMADAFAWLRIAALVDAGQREQAVELLSATMGISAEEAEMLVDGLNDTGGER